MATAPAAGEGKCARAPVTPATEAWLGRYARALGSAARDRALDASEARELIAWWCAATRERAPTWRARWAGDAGASWQGDAPALRAWWSHVSEHAPPDAAALRAAWRAWREEGELRAVVAIVQPVTRDVRHVPIDVDAPAVRASTRGEVAELVAEAISVLRGVLRAREAGAAIAVLDAVGAAALLAHVAREYDGRELAPYRGDPSRAVLAAALEAAEERYPRVDWTAAQRSTHGGARSPIDDRAWLAAELVTGIGAATLRRLSPVRAHTIG